MHHRTAPSLRAVLIGLAVLVAAGVAKLALPGRWNAADAAAHIGIIAGLAILGVWFATGLRHAADDRSRLADRLGQILEGQADLRRRDEVAASERRDFIAQIDRANDEVSGAVRALGERLSGVERVLVGFVRELGKLHASEDARARVESDLLAELRDVAPRVDDAVERAHNAGVVDGYEMALDQTGRPRPDGPHRPRLRKV